MKLLEQDKVINGVSLFEVESFYSNRGENWEQWDRDKFSIEGRGIWDFKTLSFSESVKRSLRGYHSDNLNYKYLFHVSGEIFFSILDLRQYSPTHGKHQEFELNKKNRLGIFIPPGVFNLHIAITDCIFGYLWTVGYTDHSVQYPTFKFYKAESEFGVILPKFDQGYITSERDS